MIIDQFLVAAEDKWGQRSGLTLLLPHGFEGQGPEHSSARLERFLVLAAQDNIRVVYPTTAAQYFHVLRRQVHDPDRKPLIVMTPKRYLRVPTTASPVDALTHGGVRPAPRRPEPARQSPTRIVFCTGKFALELIARRDETQAPVEIVRLEQLYPWPADEIEAVLQRSPGAEVYLGAGGAGQHGRPLLRPPPHRGDRRRPARAGGRPPREPEPRERQLDRARRRAARTSERGDTQRATP